MMDKVQRVEDYLKEVRYFSVATVWGDRPKVRPLAFHLLWEGTLYFGIGDFKEVYRQLQENPHVEIGAVRGADWLRYYGTAVFEQNGRIAQMALERMPAMRKIYNEKTGHRLAIFHLEDATAELRNQLGILEAFQL